MRMDRQAFEEYLKTRYQEQIDWYGGKADANKRYYTVIQWGVISLAVTVPALIASPLPGRFEWVPITLSVFLAIGTGALKAFKYQENWLNYRTTAETLKKEKHFYGAGAGEYATARDKERLFVERVESLISRENSLWLSTHERKEQVDADALESTGEAGGRGSS